MKPWALIRSVCSCGALVETLVYSKRHKATTAAGHAYAEQQHAKACKGTIGRSIVDPETKEPIS